ncbi:MAG: T9SS type A sorting domain-containing protein [Marinilabiliaceae bacterium]|nr:T9SS type A sorting domain-containing protein [Marinilabiliaceae bacterium]
MKDFTLKRGAIVMFLTIMSVSLAFSQGVQRIYVSTNGDDFVAFNAHGSWDDATDELQEAINALWVNGGGEIWVESGTYRPTHRYTSDEPEDTRQRSFVMREGVSVIGGFAGTETSLEQRENYGYDWNNGNPSAHDNATVFTGDLDGESAYHVVYTNGLSNNFVALSDVIITDGIADGAGVDGRGAGIQTRGGGVFNNLMIYGNMANKGGGIYAYRGGIFNNCELTDNDARDDGDFELLGTAIGGGIYLHLDGGEVNNCFFYDNYTTGSGAGICSTGGTITNSRFIINEADSKGGAVYSYGDMDGEVPTSGGTYKNCLMASNTAWVDGGGIFAADTGTWVNCTVVSNRASDGGGGVYSNTGATFTNIVIWGNESPSGGDNIVSSSGGVFTHLVVDSTDTGIIPGVNNVIISSNNIGTDVIGPHFMAPTVSAPGQGTNSTAWHANLNANWDLQISSPMINAGTPDTTGLHLGDFDLDDEARIVQDTVDVGAYELLYYAISANDPENGSVVITDDPKVLPGGSATITLTPDANFKLYSFDVNGEPMMGSLSGPEIGERSYSLADIQGNYAVEAVFVSLITYDISISSNAGGEVHLPVDEIAYEGRDYTVTIDPASGFGLYKLEVDGDSVAVDTLLNELGSYVYTFTGVSDNHEVLIDFRPYYDVTVRNTAGGIVAPLAEPGRFAEEDLSLTITPDEAYMIASIRLNDEEVSGPFPLNDEGTFTFEILGVDADVSVDIEFSLYNIITASAETGGVILNEGVTQVPVGAEHRVYIIPDEGFKLTSLMENGTPSIGDTLVHLNDTIPYLISPVDKDYVITASFTAFFVVSVSETGGGSVIIDGEKEVLKGGYSIIRIIPDPGYMVISAMLNLTTPVHLQLEIDGTSTYTILNIENNTSLDVEFGIAAGVDKIGIQDNITVIPNPVNQVLKVTGNVKSAQLLNMSGTVVAHFNQDELKGNIYVGHLANGLYILKYEDGRGDSGFIKIIIKH